MRIVNLLTVVFTSIFVGSSSGVPISQHTPTILQKLVSSLGAKTTPESDTSTHATSPSLLMSRIMYTLSNDFDRILSKESEHRRHHVRRGAPATKNHVRRPNTSNRPHTTRSYRHRAPCRNRKCPTYCGFFKIVSELVHNPSFGCSYVSKAGEARKW